MGRLLPLLTALGMLLSSTGVTNAMSAWGSATSMSYAIEGMGTTTAPCPSTAPPTPSTSTCIYAIGGGSSSTDTVGSLGVQYYDTSGSYPYPYWQRGGDLPYSAVDLDAVTAPCPGSTSPCIYIIGGLHGYLVLNYVYYYDPSTGPNGPWHQGPSLNTGRYQFGATAGPCPGNSSTTCIYAVGGTDANGNALNSAEYYDPSTGANGTWGSVTSMQLQQSGLSATAAPCPATTAGTPSTSTCIYEAGGKGTPQVRYYDPSAGTYGFWEPAAFMNTSRYFLGLTTAPCPTSSNKCLYAIGGTNGVQTLNDVEYYDPSTGAYQVGHWQTGPSLNTARQLLGATTAPCPSSSTTCIYAVGGQDANGTALKTVEYDVTNPSVTVASLTSTHLHRSGSTLTVSWHLAARTGVIGFNLYAGHHRLNAHLIPVHRSPSYTVRALYSGHAPLSLVILTRGGEVRQRVG